MTIAELEQRVREHLGQDHRYQHSLRVARSAAELARLHGVDPEKAALAGLLHDLARLYSPERLIQESLARGWEIDERSREHPTLLHAPLGAAIAAEKFGVDDPEVLSAIAKHTTGADEMSPLDRVVYLADSLEPGRDFAEREALWLLACRDLEAAMTEALEWSRRRRERKAGAAEARVSAT